MSIIGVGVDIESIHRFEPSNSSDRLIKRLFTPEEIDYCASQAKPARHYAARFAAKEAVVKSLNSVLPKLLVTQVEVYKDGVSPAPHIRLVGVAALPAGTLLHVSLSHSGDYATAFVVAEAVILLPK
jgi:holo-[acyl-carrier protein] synthase